MFKIGDTVLCIDARGSGVHLAEGRSYIVAGLESCRCMTRLELHGLNKALRGRWRCSHCHVELLACRSYASRRFIKLAGDDTDAGEFSSRPCPGDFKQKENA